MQDRLSLVRQPIYGSGGVVAYTGTAGTSSALPTAALGAWVWCTTDACVRMGATATAADWPVPAFQMVWVPVPDDAVGSSVLSAIQISSGGNAYYVAGK